MHPSRGRFFVSAAHTERDVEESLKVFEEAFSEVFR
jgi:glutamate-1-semialdehyde aminotransferase